MIVNRNLLTTLENTVEFLRKETRVKIYILDQASSYPPLLEWYKTIPEKVYFTNANEGPHSIWKRRFMHLRKNYFILTDPDCLYDGVPDDWLDKMLDVLNRIDKNKVGFSLEIDDLPDTAIGNQARSHEQRYWQHKIGQEWEAHVDTTFALYKPNAPFSYNALRLDKPYCIKHRPWYLDKENLDDEWIYYIERCSSVSTWGNRLFTQ